MAVLTIREGGQTIHDGRRIADILAGIGLTYQRWEPSHPLPGDAAADVVLGAYASEIERLKASGGYVTADVIDVHPATPGLETMLGRFRREHTHDEDEVRFVIAGRGVFHVRPLAGPVLAIETGPGDLLRVPRGTRHWFDLCAERRIRAIRLFQDPAGWTPRYTDSGAESRFDPVCLGPPPGGGGPS